MYPSPLTVENARRHDLLPRARGQGDGRGDQGPRAHAEHAPPAAPAGAHHTANDDARREADVVETVEQREPSGRDLPLAGDGVLVAELLLEGVHGLGGRVAGVVEAIVERRDGDDGEGDAQRAVEVLEDPVGRHFREAGVVSNVSR